MGVDQYGFDDGWSNGPMEDEFDLVGSLSSARPKPTGPSEDHLLLCPLASATEMLTRLDTLVSVASPDVSEGLRARLAFREASGWLAYSHIWIHQNDLMLRSSHVTSSYSAAALYEDTGRALPSTMANGHVLVSTPDDNLVEAALRLAKLWRRLAEYKTWSPLADAATLREAMNGMAWSHDLALPDIEDWLGKMKHRTASPALLRAAAAARAWGNLPDGNPDLTADGMFLGAAVFKRCGQGRSVPLPFWSAPISFTIACRSKQASNGQSVSWNASPTPHGLVWTSWSDFSWPKPRRVKLAGRRDRPCRRQSGLPYARRFSRPKACRTGSW